MLGEAGCPWARAVPGTPRLIDNCPHTLPKAAGHSPAQPGCNRHVDADRALRTPRGAKSLRCGAPSWLRLLEHGWLGADPQLGAGSPPPGFSRSGEATAMPKALPLSLAWQLRTQSPKGPSAVIWSYDIRAGTQACSLSAQRPQNSKAGCQVWVVFPCNVSPGMLPMTSLLHIPSPGRAEGAAGTPRRNC